MIAIRTVLLIALGAVCVGAPSGIAAAQNTDDRKVEDFTCKAVLRESGQNRDTAIAFLHGYMLGKSGQSDFNLGKLAEQTDAFIDSCLDNPNNKALDTMMAVKAASK